MADELLGILTGAKAPAGVDRDTDLLVRTVVGEAANQGKIGRQAVAAVARNRAMQSGKALADVLLEPKQFSAWDDPKTRPKMDALKPTDALYQTVLGEVGPVLAGEVDPTNGADHYYAHKTIAPPDWAKGEGADIGDHRFYKIGYGDSDLAGILGVTAPKSTETTGAAASPEQEALIKHLTDPSGGEGEKPGPEGAAGTLPAMVSGRLYDKDTGAEVKNPAQQKTFITLWRGGVFDPKGEPGSKNLPLIQTEEGVEPTKPGTFWVDLGGTLRMVPDDKGAMIGRGGEGAVRGGLDVMQSLGKMMPGTKDSDAGQSLEANRLVYTAQTRGDPIAGAGRFLGQAVPTTAALVAGGAALAPLKLAAGPVGSFLAGEAGIGGNLLTRGASLAASGAIEGAGAGALTSGSNDDSLGENMLTGAAIGSVAKPLAVGAFGAGRKLLAGKAAGAVPAAEQQAILDQAANLPVAVPLTQGKVTGAPAQQMEENLLLKGAKGDQAARVMQEGAAEAQSALRGNVEAIENKLTGQGPLTAGQGGATASDALNAAKSAAGKKVDAAYDAARTSGDGAFLPAEQRPIVAQHLREAIKDYDPELVAPVVRVLDAFDGTGGTLTPRDLFEARSRLGKLRATNDPQLGGAAAETVRALDGYIDEALKADLISGDPKAVDLWKKAIGERKAFGKLFEGRDLIADLTKQEYRGGERTLSVAPEDASNLIFGRSGLGAVGRKNLSRDLARLKNVLGTDSEAWNALRGEAFKRLAREGEGAPEAGHTQFSGQKFLKAWNKLKADNPQVVDTLFSADERQLITDFAETAQRATTSVKGGDNPSNSGVLVVKKVLDNLWTAVGGAVGSIAGPGGAAAGATVGKGLDGVFKDMGAVVQAQKALKPKVVKPAPSGPPNRLVGTLPAILGGIEGNKLLGATP